MCSNIISAGSKMEVGVNCGAISKRVGGWGGFLPLTLILVILSAKQCQAFETQGDNGPKSLLSSSIVLLKGCIENYIQQRLMHLSAPQNVLVYLIRKNLVEREFQTRCVVIVLSVPNV